MKRVGLLAAVLVLAFGSGVVAHESSPVPSPGYAPDDLAYALPPTIGDIEMDVFGFSVGYFPTSRGYEDAWRDVLVPLGKDPMDVRTAVATDLDDDLRISVEMVRVDGVQAVDLWEGVWRGQNPTITVGPSDVEWQWQDIAGRRIAVVDWRVELGGSEVAGTDYVYPKGEALFIIETFALGDAEPLPIEDVLAELP